MLCAQGILFPALRRVKLIPEDAEVASLDYSRCGRTDKGVSALGQVRLAHCAGKLNA
jgi:tRNA pseudouridine38/39 synthase